MGALSNKILTYSPEQFIRFNTAYSTSPTNLGSGGQGSWSLSNEAPILNATGGPESEGCWQFNWGGNGDNTTTRFRVLSSSNVINLPEITDGSYSAGLWFRFTQPITTSTAMGSNYTFFTIASESYYATISVVVGNTSNVNRGKLSTIHTQSGGTTVSANRVDDGSWHYVTMRFNKTATGVFDGDVYLDGQLLSTISQRTWTPSSVFVTEIGNLSNTTSPDNLGLMEFANFYNAPYSAINPTAISEIWTVGSSSGSTNVTLLEEPATATALQVDATISAENIITISETLNASAEFPNPTSLITTDANSVNIETSITVTSEMVEPLFTTDISATILLDFSLDASSDVVDPTLSFTTNAANTADALEVTAESTEPVITLTANKNLPGTAYAVSATFPDNIYVTSDDQVVYSATPMFASNAEMPNPSYGAVNPDPLYYTEGTLKSKIATYPIEFGAEFNNLVGLNTNTYGSNTVGSTQPAVINSYSGAVITLQNDGPFASGTQSLENFAGSPAARFRFAGTQTSPDANSDSNVYNDYNFTSGVWFRVLEPGTGTSPIAAAVLGYTPSSWTVGTNPLGQGFLVSLSGTSHATNPRQLNLYTGGTTFSFFGPSTLDTGWHYLAVRRTSQNATNNFEVYLDGELALTRTVTTTGTTSTALLFGPGSNATYTALPPSQVGRIRYQNFHSGTASNLTPFRINEIYLAGTLFPPAESINAVHNAPPAYATANMVAPTVVAVLGDNVEIATSILVSSLMVNPDFSTGEKVTINAEVLGTASADIGDNITLDTFKDHVQAPEEFTATAVMVMPRISEFPFYATAQLVNPQVFISPNRFAMVMNQNPLFYIEDGQPNPTNYGSWDVNSWDTEYFDTNIQAGQELNAVGNQKAWRANANGIILREPEIRADITDYEQKIEALYASKKLSIELWYWSIAEAKGFETGFGQYTESGMLFSDGITQIGEVYDWFGCGPNTNPANEFVLISNIIAAEFVGGEGTLPFVTYRTYYDAQPKRYQWNQVVVTYEPIVGEPNKINQKVYMNGSIISNLDLVINNSFGELNFSTNFNSPSMKGPQLGYSVNLTGSQQLKLNDGVKLDEFAIYPVTLTSNQVVERYNFIRSLSPDAEYLVDGRDSQAAMGNHTFVAVANFVWRICRSYHSNRC